MLVYLVLSLMCSAINEQFEGWLKHRAVDLENGRSRCRRRERAADGVA